MPLPVSEPMGSNLDRFRSRASIDVPGNAPFMLVHHTGKAGSFEVGYIDGEPHVLPVLSPLPIRPGAAGVRSHAETEPPEKMYEGPHARLRRQGAVILDWSVQVQDPEHLPPGAAPGPWIRELPARDGVFYHELWDRPSRGIRTDAVVTECDRNRRNRWRLSLIQSGIIPAPSAEVVADMLSRAKRKLDLVRNNQGMPEDVRAERADVHRRRLDAMKGARVPGRPAPERAAGPVLAAMGVYELPTGRPFMLEADTGADKLWGWMLSDTDDEVEYVWASRAELRPAAPGVGLRLLKAVLLQSEPAPTPAPAAPAPTPAPAAPAPTPAPAAPDSPAPSPRPPRQRRNAATGAGPEDKASTPSEVPDGPQ